MLEINKICKNYDAFALKDIDLWVEKGEYFVLLGPSGAGKTLLFETISGLIHPDSGSIVLEGAEISKLPVSERGVGIVFQDGAVFPHMTVRKNIGYALRWKRKLRSIVERRITELAESVDISHLLNRMPDTLSGGELQRVAIARTLAQEPKILLLDEPLSSLDYQLRQDIRYLLKKINKHGLTILHITHDYHEAFYLADKLAIIDQGEIIQTGTPDEIISNPRSSFVAGFIGIRNNFAFTRNKDGYISIGNQIQLKASTDLPEGIVFMPNDCLKLAKSSTEGMRDHEIRGKVVHKVRFPEAFLLVIDIGVILHYYSMLVLGDKTHFEPGSEVLVKIDSNKLIFQEK